MILDPHHSWSRSFQDFTGGPVFDTVDFTDPEWKSIANQLAAFGSFQFDPKTYFDSTIIRLPLRTAEQAKRSRIVARETVPEDIRHAFKDFGRELENGGILFVRNVRKVTVRVDNEVYFSTEIINEDALL